MFLQAHNLRVFRSGREVLHDLSLQVQPGQCLAVVGPNGAGKSTLMQALLGLLPLASGSVRLDGLPLQSHSRRQIARRIAYLPQSYEGYLGFQVRDVVKTGRYAHRGPLEPWDETDRLAVDQALRQCHLLDLQHRTVEALSGGERQKVWLAAALAQQSPALFLDEPTSALDPKHQVELIRLLQAQLAAGKTVMLICHDLNLPATLQCPVLALRDGRVVFEGPVEKLFDLQRLEQIFEAPFEVVRLEPGGQLRVHLRV
jgi:iron complex transport system ATP-binding protein